MSKNLEYRDRIDKQLLEFSEDTSYFAQYDTIQIKDQNSVLVRVFFFKPAGQGIALYKPDPVNGGMVLTTNSLDSTPMHIAKVIKSNDPDYKPGDIVVLTYDKVRGYIPNPEMQMYERSQKVQGLESFEPEDTRNKIPRVEAMWKDLTFVRPWLLEPEDEDRLTYCLPNYEIKSLWDLKAYLQTLKTEV